MLRYAYVAWLVIIITRHSLLHLCFYKETEERSDHDNKTTANHYRTSIGSVEGQ